MLRIHPAPSRLRFLLALFLHGLALTALFHSGAPFWLKSALAPLVFCGLWLEAQIALGRRQVVAMQIGARSVKLRIDGESMETGPPQVRHCSEWLVIVEFPVRGAESGHRRFHLVLFPDSLLTDERRRLRRWIYFYLGR
ncbi:MAG: hypothetical protein F4Y22_00855 [Gammaproteobacteria bacterium]|nr:hypothetical protein [Gammaproteobacteria bacterium]MYH45815.1 hypothetical protein [Gammaproteobacteria bacterium]MYL12765.1 hypothetical protein [Gammaproteobacteria bacterium]